MLKEALERKGFQIISYTVESPTKLRIAGRVLPAGESSWAGLLTALLLASEGDRCSGDVSKTYFMQDTPNGRKPFFDWRLIFQGSSVEDVDAYLSPIVDAVVATPAKAEVMSIPLHCKANRNEVNDKGKGVLPYGSLPAALTRRGR